MNFLRDNCRECRWVRD